MSELPAYRRAARTIPCGYCDAAAGDPCRSPSGRATYEHGARYNACRPAQNIGYEEGLRDALNLLKWKAQEDVETARAVEHVRSVIFRQYEAVRRMNKREATR